MGFISAFKGLNTTNR